MESKTRNKKPSLFDRQPNSKRSLIQSPVTVEIVDTESINLLKTPEPPKLTEEKKEISMTQLRQLVSMVPKSYPDEVSTDSPVSSNVEKSQPSTTSVATKESVRTYSNPFSAKWNCLSSGSSHQKFGTTAKSSSICGASSVSLSGSSSACSASSVQVSAKEHGSFPDFGSALDGSSASMLNDSEQLGRTVLNLENFSFFKEPAESSVLHKNAQNVSRSLTDRTVSMGNLPSDVDSKTTANANALASYGTTVQTRPSLHRLGISAPNLCRAQNLIDFSFSTPVRPVPTATDNKENINAGSAVPRSGGLFATPRAPSRNSCGDGLHNYNPSKKSDVLQQSSRNVLTTSSTNESFKLELSVPTNEFAKIPSSVEQNKIDTVLSSVDNCTNSDTEDKSTEKLLSSPTKNDILVKSATTTPDTTAASTSSCNSSLASAEIHRKSVAAAGSTPGPPPGLTTSSKQFAKEHDALKQTVPVAEIRPAAAPTSTTVVPSSPGQEEEEEIKIFTVNGHKYTAIGVLGSGGSCKVYQVLRKNKIYALKVVDLPENDPVVRQSYLKEIDILSQLAGKNCTRVVRLYEYELVESENVLLVVLEKGETDLSSFLRQHRTTGQGRLDFFRIQCCWHDMLKAVQEIHKHRIIHLDLKPSNFLFVNGTLKLIDFGISNQIQADITSVTMETQMGTLSYISPEVLEGGPRGVRVNEKSDVWSLGCILYMMMGGKPPFAKYRTFFEKTKAMMEPERFIEYPTEWSREVIDVLKRCLRRDPKERSTIQELLDHPFLR